MSKDFKMQVIITDIKLEDSAVAVKEPIILHSDSAIDESLDRALEYQKLAKSTAEHYMDRLAKRRGVVVLEYRHRYVVIDNEKCS
jgi:hypothetical protein